MIPKGDSQNARIREGDPLEIFVDRDGEVILKNIRQSVNLVILWNMPILFMRQWAILL